MSARSSIAKGLKDVLKDISTLNGYQSNVHPNNVHTTLKFWDEVSDFPSICIVPGSEAREYHPAGFKWGFLHISIKLYVKLEDPLEQLEKLIEDVELAISSNEVIEYESGKATTEILIDSITTDEGLLAPYGVGEVNITVRYDV